MRINILLRVYNKKSICILSFILSCILVFFLGNYTQDIQPKSTEILWDTYGIPHIYGRNARSAFQAFGWAQMQSHGNLLLRLYGQARGRAAEYWGEKYIESDRWVLTMGVPERARSWYNQQSSTFRSYFDAFAAGINAYASQHADLIDDQVEAVLPVKGEDVMAHLHRVLHFTFVVNPKKIAGVKQQKSQAGSNAWAIAPTRSGSGNAMLLANPHLPWSDLFLWYEAQITAPEIDVYGATLVGFPALAIAFNNNLGWTYTVNTFDGWDTYQLTLDGNGYRFDGKLRNFQTKTLTLKVKQKDGSLQEQSLVVKSSVHGPVIVEKDGKAVALRVVGLDQPNIFRQLWDMARAKNLTQFEIALKQLQLPMFTVIYADREGHIMSLFNGQVPVRSEGDFKYWQGMIPGDTSKTLWTKIHPYHDLPRVTDPPSGWLQNANDPPWTTTFAPVSKADDYPSYIAPRGPMSLRSQRSTRMLDEDEKISFDEMVEYKHSTRMELADRILDDLILATQKYGDQLGQRAVRVLETWDRQANADSRGAVLFAFWIQEMDLNNAFSQPWSENSPRTTPDGLANPESAVGILETVAANIEKAYGALDVPWGDVFRLHYGNLDLPANGGDSSLGIFRVLNFASASNGQLQAVAGDSYVAAIEFSNPVRAMVLTSYGNASQPSSPYFGGEQLQMFARKQLRPVWRTRKEITANLQERFGF